MNKEEPSNVRGDLLQVTGALTESRTSLINPGRDVLRLGKVRLHDFSVPPSLTAGVKTSPPVRRPDHSGARLGRWRVCVRAILMPWAPEHVHDDM